MTHLYECTPCSEGRHNECEVGHSVPKGYFGGSICTCCGNIPFKVRKGWISKEDKINWFAEQARRNLKYLLDNKRIDGMCPHGSQFPGWCEECQEEQGVFKKEKKLPEYKPIRFCCYCGSKDLKKEQVIVFGPEPVYNYTCNTCGEKI